MAGLIPLFIFLFIGLAIGVGYLLMKAAASRHAEPGIADESEREQGSDPAPE
jgi:hypothetical protein